MGDIDWEEIKREKWEADAREYDPDDYYDDDYDEDWEYIKEVNDLTEEATYCNPEDCATCEHYHGGKCPYLEPCPFQYCPRTVEEAQEQERWYDDREARFREYDKVNNR